MEIGSEISRKIRTAIKGKLQELGAYVDEELPDYIMVMVANKKSQELMVKDLSLFLGNNTLRFTTWLQGVLDKLRAVTPGSNSLKASEAIIFNSSMPPLVSQSREDSGREPQIQRQETFHSMVPSSSQQQHGSDRASADAAVAARLTSAVKPLQESSPSEDIIDLKLDTDDPFNDDLSYSSESSLHSRKKPAELSYSRTQRPTAQVYRPPPRAQHLDERSGVHRLSQSSHVPTRQSSFHDHRGVGTKRYELQEVYQAEETFRSAVGTERALQEFDVSRKRKIPVASSIVKVKRFLEEFEEEEEEDEDSISHAAALPSSVSVPSRPERRPTLPPSKQANKNLILKAISEAQESITKTTSYTTVPPKQMVPVAPRARPIPEEELILLKSRASMLRYQEEPIEAPALESRQGDHRMDVLSRLHPEPVEDTTAWAQVGDRRMDVLSRLHPEPVEEAIVWAQEAEESESLRPMDSRSFILKNPKVSKMPPVQTPPTTDSTPQFGRLIQPRENVIPEKPASPKFIVTLDGVPSPRGYHSDEDMEVEPSVYPEEGLYADPNNPLVRAEQSHLIHPGAQDVPTFTVDPSAVPAKAKIHERCKYWPACKNAEHCAYHHPTTVCKAFPKCRFAEKCFFIHPNCKFDAKCTKADCPYTHASRRIPPPPVRQEQVAKTHVKVQCRYFPSCKNTECPYFHPKHCRFSSHCTRTDCEFYHPTTAVPPRHALTWTRSQAAD